MNLERKTPLLRHESGLPPYAANIIAYELEGGPSRPPLFVVSRYHSAHVEYYFRKITDLMSNSLYEKTGYELNCHLVRFLESNGAPTAVKAVKLHRVYVETDILIRALGGNLALAESVFTGDFGYLDLPSRLDMCLAEYDGDELGSSDKVGDIRANYPKSLASWLNNVGRVLTSNSRHGRTG